EDQSRTTSRSAAGKPSPMIVVSFHMVPPKVEQEMAVYGYARVSTNGQDLGAQVAELKAAGCGNIYQETASGAKTDRPALARLIRRLEDGDVLTVVRLDRLARSTRDLLNILDEVGKRDAGFRSL